VKAIAELGLLILFASACAAQIGGRSVAQIRKLRVTHGNGIVKIEVILTGSVVPSVKVTTGPDRLIMDLPGAATSARQQHIVLNSDGVKQLRIGLNNASPLVSRLVVDLDAAHQYALATDRNTVTLTVLPGTAAAQSKQPDAGAVPAASGPLLGMLFQRGTASPANPGAKTKTETLLKTAPSKAGLRTTFRVKYVAEGAAYLNGGRSSGLAEGMKLEVRDSSPANSTAAPGPVVAELQVVSVAETSAVTEIRDPKRDVKPGDWAYLSAADSAKLGVQSSASPGTPQPALLQGEPRKPELRPALLPEDSRIQGRIGFDYSGIRSSGSTPGNSTQLGFTISTDMTRIAGTYWNLQGYMRDRLTSNSQPEEETMQNYLDRTYTLQLYYDNPNSKWVAGFGRLYLPWAVSIDTIDGGYVGRKLTSRVTTGVFFGSTPNPTSWNYKPDQQTGGWFANYAGGSFESFHYSSTTGMAVDSLKWQIDRPYLFLENEVSYKKLISIYHSFIVDSPQGVTTDGIKPGTGISRSYLTLHIQPSERISFDIYHNYFRDTPTAATALIATGLVDKLLYQGLSASVRIEPIRHFFIYTTIGQSDKTGDTTHSLNQAYGIAWSEIWRTGIRADLHYSKFAGSFAQGDYRVLSLSRHIGDRIMWDAQFGGQTLNSPLTVNRSSFFVDTSFDTNLGSHSFLQSGYTVSRGDALNYTQWYLSLGYRFKTKGMWK